MKPGVRSKIYLGMFSLLLLLGLVIFFLVTRIMKESLLEENRNRGVSLAVNLSARMVEPLLAMDFLRMKTLVDETVRLSDDISYTFVLNNDQKPLVHTFKGGFPVELIPVNVVSNFHRYSMRPLDTGDNLVYDYAVPVFVGRDRLGTLRIGLFTTRIEKTFNRIMVSALLSTLFVILIAVFAATFLVRPVTQSIKRLHDSTERALRGDLDIHTAPLLKKNCWDIMACHRTECPAYGNLYHRCWYTAGTLCPTCVEGDYAGTISSCRNCAVYRKCAGDEIQSLAESFDSMILSLKNNLSGLEAADKTLKKQKNVLRTILDTVPDFISLQDRNGVYISVNWAFCKMLGKTEDEIIGKTTFDVFPGKQAEVYHQEDLDLFLTGEPLDKENRVVKGNCIKWYHLVKIPILEGNAQISGLLCSGRDITEFKRVQEQLTQAQKMESLGQLAAGIAHEINTPLGVILGYAQLLLEAVEDSSQDQEDLRIIVKQTKIASRIVADLLKFSRPVESVVSEVDINQAVEDVLSVVEHSFNLELVVIKRAYGAHLPPVKGDEEKLKQVFVNLLKNALDAMGDGGVITIKTNYLKQQGELLVSVSDTGHGISSANMKKIFDPFFTTKGVGRGTGLGLSVTFGIIKELGGTIEVKSPLVPEMDRRDGQGPGTGFFVYLPVNNGAGVNGSASSRA
ncbi:MAG: PAS domain S-box protein [Desulfobacteraceae bacterium]|nr:PAS domain S-box protein [Desulfobacteraceae bacterium]